VARSRRASREHRRAAHAPALPIPPIAAAGRGDGLTLSGATRSRSLLLLAALCVTVACRQDLFGASASASPAGSTTPVSTAAPTFRFIPDQESSLFTIRVREQLAGFTSLSDAVLTTTAISGVIGLTRDGRLTADTNLKIDLSKLQSDESRRDSFIKQDTLQTQRYPNAEMTVVGTIGLPQPLPQSGEWKFTLVTSATVHGTTHEVSWDVTGQRVGREIRATARTTVHFADFGLERPSVAAVLSVQDEIRLEVLLRAVQG
jgi:polyisoprenoid-binding protein YceI